MHRYLRIAIVSAVLIGSLCSATRISAQEGNEYQVKAAFVLNFLRLTEFVGRDADRSEYKICVLASPAVLNAFEGVSGKTVNGKPVNVLALPTKVNPRCDVLFIGEEESNRLNTISPSVINSSGLTVGEGEEPSAREYMIRFFIEDSRVKFEINLHAVPTKQVRFSSKLMSLARVVGGN